MANNVIATTEQREEIRDSISKYNIKDEMDRLFGQDDVSAVINAGFEKTKKQLEHAVSLFPDENKEYANTVIEKNGMYLIVDFSDNVRLVIERVFQLTMDVGLKQIKKLFGRKASDEIILQAGKEIVEEVFTPENISIKVDEIGEMYMDYFLKEATKTFEGGQIPAAIRALMDKNAE